jgi:hypothetical protein
MTRFAACIIYADALLTPARIRLWAAAALTVQLVVGLITILGTHGFLVPLDRPCTTDFVSFYAAGLLTDGSDPTTLYNPTQLHLAEQTATESGIDYVPFFYPPVFALLCGLLAHLPYIISFVLFEVFTTSGCLLIIGRIVGRDIAGWWLPFVSFSPLLWNAGIGQNAALSAGLVGAATLLHRRSPFLAGLTFSCLLYKPHMGILVGPTLAASKPRAAFIGGLVGCACLSILCSAWFGLGIWRSFLQALGGAETGFSRGQIVPFVSTASIFGAARLLGADRMSAYAVEAVIGIIAAYLAASCWRRSSKKCTDLRYAALAAATPILMPVVLFYDTSILLIAAAWLVRAMRREGPLPGERLALAVIWLAGLVCYPFCRTLHLPIAASMAPLLMLIIIRRDVVSARDKLFCNKSSVVRSSEHHALS